jgi:hypothetical protein
MISGLSKSILFFLTILQLFAPLVHAHTGDSRIKIGLHVPGLENYQSNKHTLVSQSVNSDWVDEGLAVMVDAGIKVKHDGLVQETGQVSLTLSSQWLTPQALTLAGYNFSPHPNPLVPNNPLDSVLAPRAPPAQ